MNSISSSSYFALIPAAGVGARMAANCPKQYLHIGGKSILQHSVNAFLSRAAIAHVFVVVSPEDAYAEHELVKDARLTLLYCGGATRSESVLNGLLAIQERVAGRDWILVHDAARPGLQPDLIQRLIAEVGNNEAGGLLALPVVDTVKSQPAETGAISTVPRAGLWLAQTPQMFRHAPLLAALTAAQDSSYDITDDASAMEACGWMPKLVEGHWCNTKITRPEDLVMVEMYLNQHGVH